MARDGARRRLRQLRRYAIRRRQWQFRTGPGPESKTELLSFDFSIEFTHGGLLHVGLHRIARRGILVVGLRLNARRGLLS